MVSVVPSGELSPDPSMASVKAKWSDMSHPSWYYAFCPFLLHLVSVGPNRNPSLCLYPTSARRNEVVGGGSSLLYIPPPPQCQWGPVGSWTFTSTLEQKSGLNHSQLLLPYLYPHSEVIRWCMSGGCPYFFQEGVNETKRIAELPPQLSETRQWASTFWFCWSGISGAQQKAPCTYPPRCHTTHQQGDWLLKTKIK